ncbi:hypothetical protein JOM56_004125 [Amanita muscaria]
MALNKPRVLPTALHSELTEYSSLLRTLRTNNILDVSLHITQSGRDGNILVSDEEEIPSQDPTWQEQVTDAVDNGNGTNRKREREQHGQKRDNWTRWPLLLKDVYKPTWNFEDEVAIVASQALKLNSTSLPSSQEDDPQTCPAERTEYANNDAEDDDLGADDPEVPSYYKYIAMSTYDFLLNTLALIASHPPPRPPSMQNRIEPLDWRSVLEIVSAYGDYSVVDEQILNQVQARMETLYALPGKSSFPEFEDGESSVAFRVRKKNEAERQLDDVMLQAFESLFELPPPSFIEPPKPKRRRKATTSKKETPELASTLSGKDKKGKARSKNDKEPGTEKGEDSSPHAGGKGKEVGVGKAKGTVQAKGRVREKDKDRDEATSPKTRKNFKSRAIISDSSDDGEVPMEMDIDDQVRIMQPHLEEAEDVNTAGDVNSEIKDLGL